MEPAGWATVAASLVAMFGAIAVALIQRRRGKPQQWNGVERRTMETIATQIADGKVTRHALSCPMQKDLKDLRDHMERDFRDMRETLASELQAMRTLIFNMKQP